MNTINKIPIFLFLSVIILMGFIIPVVNAGVANYQSFKIIEPLDVNGVFSANPTTVYHTSTADYGSNSGTRYTYLKFNFTGVFGITNNTYSVKKAYLIVDTTTASANTYMLSNLYPVNTDYDVTTLIWNNKPSDNNTVVGKSTFTGRTGVSPTYSPIIYDITTYIQELKNNNGNNAYGFRIYGSESTTTGTVRFNGVGTYTSYIVITFDSLTLNAPTSGTGWYIYDGNDYIPYPTPNVGDRNYVWNGTDFINVDDRVTTVTDNILTLFFGDIYGNGIGIGIPLIIILAVSFFCYRFAGAWGFFAGMNIGVILCVYFEILGLWVVILLAIVDILGLLGKIPIENNKFVFRGH